MVRNEAREPRGDQLVVDGVEPFGTFGVMSSHIVPSTRWMSDVSNWHNRPAFRCR